jgi:hypothetical protein
MECVFSSAERCSRSASELLLIELIYAVKTQIWCAVSTYVLIAIVKKELQLNASLYTLLQILSVSVFEKTDASSALQLDRHTIDNADIDNQLNLFTF